MSGDLGLAVFVALAGVVTLGFWLYERWSWRKARALLEEHGRELQDQMERMEAMEREGERDGRG